MKIYFFILLIFCAEIANTQTADLLFKRLYLNFSKPPKISNPQCYKKYSELFNKDSVDIRIIFGYKDARPARFVADRYERLTLINSLLARCNPNRFDCDFVRSRDDGDLLIKYIKGLDNKIHKIELRLVSSSVSPDDEANQKDPFQKWKSNKAAELFFEGLRQADIIFYNGHSRDGGGPDFLPPRLTHKHHIDYHWYRTKQLGLKNMHKALKTAKKPPAIVGLFSCRSDQLVPKAQVSAQSEWITSKKLLYFADALQNIKDSLSETLGMHCQNGLAHRNEVIH
jgi:hypothetical protein